MSEGDKRGTVLMWMWFNGVRRRQDCILANIYPWKGFVHEWRSKNVG